MALPAITMRGLAVKARAAALVTATPSLWDDDDLYMHEEALMHLIETICTSAGVSLEEVRDWPPEA